MVFFTAVKVDLTVNSRLEKWLSPRNASLQHVNNMLREQLEQATNANNQLTIELQKVTNDYTKAVEELEQRENDEEKYFTEEHEKILKLWAAINSFRRGFNEMKLETQK